MRVYEAIVRGLEGVGVGAAFGGAGENAAGLMLALKHSASIRPVITRHEQAASFMACGYAMYSGRLGCLFRDGRPRRIQSVFRTGGRHVGLLSGAGDLGLCLARLERQGRAQRDVRGQPHAQFAGDVCRDDQEIVPARRCQPGPAMCWRRRSIWPSRDGPDPSTSTSRRTSPIAASPSTIIATSIFA